MECVPYDGMACNVSREHSHTATEGKYIGMYKCIDQIVFFSVLKKQFRV